MSSNSPVEIADQYSRKRAGLVAVAAVAFLVIHGIMRPFFYTTDHRSIDWWAINAVALLAALATGGGVLNRRQIRELVNDEVARKNYRQAVVAGFWVAMMLAMALYLWPGFRHFTARDASYLVVTASLGVALLAFAFFEYRAHRDG
jgi:hypothetical protein